MVELTFISNKTRKELLKYFFVTTFAVITWVLQLSIFNRLAYFDTTPNVLFLGSIYFGLAYGPLTGIFFGITSSFFCASILYDHSFYFSYPLIGLFAGLLTKNFFSDELLFYILLVFLFTFPFEFLNGWQYSLTNPISVLDRYLSIGLYSSILNLLVSPFFYFLTRFVTKKLKLW